MSVRAAPRGQTLTRNQRRFNQLTARLQELRNELASWQRATDRFRQRAAFELEPLGRKLLEEQRAAVLLLEALLAGGSNDAWLTRRRRKKLTELIAVVARTVLDAGPDDAIEAIFDRNSKVRYSEIRRGELELAEALVEVVGGEDLMAGHTARNVEELLEQAGERFNARIELEAERRHEQAQQRRAKGRKQEHERQASQSVRDLFRKLVAALHPDRELDSAERVRKTALMQRVNRAYEANDLLELLTVQIEIEQIDSGHLAQASEQRLGHYCAVLREQQSALEAELFALQAPLRAALDLPPCGDDVKAEMLDMLLAADVKDARETLDQLRADVAALRDPSRRAALVDSLEIERGEPDPFDFAFEPAPSAPRPQRRRTAKNKSRRR